MKLTRNGILINATVAFLFVGLSAGAHDAQHFAAGEPGDPKKPSRIVKVIMRETDEGKMIYEPKKLTVTRGEQIRFVLRNAGEIPHEFVIGNKEENDKHAAMMQKYPDMEHDDPNGKSLQPKASTEIIWRFSKSGEFEFACLIPGHRESGMLGTISVK